MKVSEIIPKILIMSLIINTIIPFSGYLIIILIFIYLMIKGNLYDFFNMLSNEKFTLCFLIYIIFTFIKSDYKLDSLFGIFIVIDIIFLYLLIRKYGKTDNFITQILDCFIICNIIISSIGIVQFYFIDFGFLPGWIDKNVYETIRNRAFSTLLNPNVLAGYLVFSISLFITDIEEGSVKKIKLTAIILSTYCLVLTYSRGAWLSLLVTLIIGYIYRRKVLYIIYGLIFYISIIVINGYSGIERLSVTNALKDHSLFYRKEIYKTMINIIQDNFLFGTGLNTMQHYINRYSEIIKAPVYHGHNIILNIMGETGLIGLIFFAIIVLTLFKNICFIMNSSKVLYKFSLSCMLGFTSILVHGLTDAVLIAPQFLFFISFIFGLVMNARDMVAQCQLKDRLVLKSFKVFIRGGI